MKKGLKENNVPKVNVDTYSAILLDVIKMKKEEYDKKNKEIYEKQRQHVKDSIDYAKRKNLEREEYRKSHDWRDLSMSAFYGLKCDFCNDNHFMKKFRVVSISADTLYYLLDKPDIKYLGTNFWGIHYSALTPDFKKDNSFQEYVRTWQDSIANNNTFSTQDVGIFNAIQYSEFKDKIYAKAPNGFMLKWGWELNSAQGIEPYFSFFNSSRKTIKYIDFYFSILNGLMRRY